MLRGPWNAVGAAGMALLLALGALRLASPEPSQAAATVQDDGLSVVAVRVEPHTTSLNGSGHLVGQSCLLASTACRGQVGWRVEPLERTASQEGALFWRAQGELSWRANLGQDTELALQIVAHACSGTCRDIVVAETRGKSPLTLERFDIFRAENVTSLRAVIASASDSAAPPDISYTMAGALTAYIAAGEPFVLHGSQEEGAPSAEQPAHEVLRLA